MWAVVKDLISGYLKKYETSNIIEILKGKRMTAYKPRDGLDFSSRKAYAIVKRDSDGVKRIRRVRILQLTETEEQCRVDGIKNPSFKKQDPELLSDYVTVTEKSDVKKRRHESKVTNNISDFNTIVKKFKASSDEQPKVSLVEEVGLEVVHQALGDQMVEPSVQVEGDDSFDSLLGSNMEVPRVLKEKGDDSFESLPGSNMEVPRIITSEPASKIIAINSSASNPNAQQQVTPAAGLEPSQSCSTPGNVCEVKERESCSCLQLILEEMGRIRKEMEELKDAINGLNKTNEQPLPLSNANVWPNNAVSPDLPPPENTPSNMIYCGLGAKCLAVDVVDRCLKADILVRSKISHLAMLMFPKSLKTYWLQKNKGPIFPGDSLLAITNLLNVSSKHKAMPGESYVKVTTNFVADKLSKILYDLRKPAADPKSGADASAGASANTGAV